MEVGQKLELRKDFDQLGEYALEELISTLVKVAQMRQAFEPAC